MQLVLSFYFATFEFVVMVNYMPNDQHVAKKKCSIGVWGSATLKLE